MVQKASIRKGLAQLVKPLSRKFWLEEVLEDCLSKHKEKDRIVGFHASSAGGCPRLIQLQLNNMVDSTPDFKGRRIFDNGHKTHERYGEYFQRSDKFVAAEKRIRIKAYDFYIYGSADFIIKDYDNLENVLELKTINNRRYEALCLANEPIIENFLQINLYMKGLKIPRGVIIYENKDTQQVRFFPVVFDKEKYNETIEIFHYINECNKVGKYVEKPDPCPNPVWCSAKNFCKKA